MDKAITVSLFGVGGSKRGSAYNNYIWTGVWIDEEFKVDSVREYIKENWNWFLKKGINITNEFRYKMTISIITSSNVRFKSFEIDPKELR